MSSQAFNDILRKEISNSFNILENDIKIINISKSSIEVYIPPSTSIDSITRHVKGFISWAYGIFLTNVKNVVVAHSNPVAFTE